MGLVDRTVSDETYWWIDSSGTCGYLCHSESVLSELFADQWNKRLEFAISLRTAYVFLVPQTPRKLTVNPNDALGRLSGSGFNYGGKIVVAKAHATPRPEGDKRRTQLIFLIDVFILVDFQLASEDNRIVEIQQVCKPENKLSEDLTKTKALCRCKESGIWPLGVTIINKRTDTRL